MFIRAAPSVAPSPSDAAGTATGFKSVGDPLCATAATWAFSMSALYVTQDHPVHIPQAQRVDASAPRLVGDT
jgi:hypothetical protein